MKKVNLGLDIGITSVGWAVLDEDFRILKHGVRLFNKMEDAKTLKLNNVQRREKRSMRRMKNRHQNLKKDFIKFLVKKKWIKNINIGRDNLNLIADFVKKYIVPLNAKNEKNGEPYILKLRCEGIARALNKKELIAVLYWYLSTRGFKYQEPEQKAEIEKIRKEILEKTGVMAQYPAQIQHSYFLEKGFYRGHINQIFHTDKYWDEISLILNETKKELNLIDDDFIVGFKNLFSRQRSYEKGPGSYEAYAKIKNLANRQKIISPYSRFYIDKKSGKLKAHENMWEKSIGKCTYFKDEFRAPRESLTSELFNLLNDLNNLKLNQNDKVTQEQKVDCIKLSMDVKDNSNSIMKYFSKQDIDITGYRINKKKKPEFTNLKTWNLFKKYFPVFVKNHNFFLEEKKEEFDINIIEVIDDFVEGFSKSKIIEKRIDFLEKEFLPKWSTKYPNLKDDANSKEQKELIASKAPSFSETHNLSFKFMRIAIDIMIASSVNQQNVAHEANLVPWNQNNRLSKSKYIGFSWLDAIGSPTTRRAIRQSIKVINRIIKSYSNEWKIDNIVIEMARDLNAKDEKDSISSLQKFNENRRKKLKVRIDQWEKETGSSPSKASLSKLWLWEQQEECDAYTGEKIDLTKALSGATQIDHIIPYSFCYDDSLNNKVLVLRKTNQLKGQRTPYQLFREDFSLEKFSQMKQKWQNWFQSENKEKQDFLSQKKWRNLTTEIDFQSHPENALDFINRNLVDTRWTTREMLSILKEFINKHENNHMLSNCKIKTVNGRFTSITRRMVENVRDENGNKITLKRPEGIEDGSFDEKTGQKVRIWHGHHAEDAVIVVHCALKNPALNKIIEKTISHPNMTLKDKQRFMQNKILENWNDKNVIDFRVINQELNDKYQKVKFSRMLEKRINIEMTNETLYSAKKIQLKKDKEPLWHKIVKYELKGMKKDRAKKLFESDKYFILMKKYDPKTFNVLKSYWESGDTDKPFEHERFDDHGALTLEFKNKNNVLTKRKIKYLKILKEAKNEEEILQVKNIDSKNITFKESFDWVAIQIFKDPNNRYRLLPLTALMINLGVKKSKNWDYKKNYSEKLKEWKIEDNQKPLIELYRGSLIENSKKEIFYLVGHSWKQDILEFKPLKRQELSSENRLRFTLNTKLKNSNFFSQDELGENSKHIFKLI